jgi:hypothetical protein
LQRCEQDGVVYYRFPSLAEWPGLVHAVFTRWGGVSRPPFANLNLGHTVGDDPAAVETNHRQVYRVLEARPEAVVTAWLVHGREVATVDAAHGGQVIPRTDGLITRTPGVILFQRFADCLPILLFDPVQRAVGIAHAGWRGTVRGVARATVEAMSAAFGTHPTDLIAALGPGIGPCCYEVGDDVIQAVRSAFERPDGLLPARNGAVHFDLLAANARQLAALGVRTIEIAELCTACRTDEFFSHRAERGRTGRFGVAIGFRDGGA